MAEVKEETKKIKSEAKKPKPLSLVYIDDYLNMAKGTHNVSDAYLAGFKAHMYGSHYMYDINDFEKAFKAYQNS
ncbi:hypothetical protein [Bacillus thuringiensis]|uniref:hypothetical protein n=1 Tax=Bacillus thuringiensis TaxID=1428 RepID=UPI000A38D517|nr:hypothetical protein [Bacillus thuringiensis]OTZ58770.1 hypothetical protein BK762_00210 [Bacillus thuringiensis serovar toumanoffi]